ncbi:MAG: hypothetical protein ACPLRM_04835, partial [Anaerolineae bacterium]
MILLPMWRSNPRLISVSTLLGAIHITSSEKVIVQHYVNNINTMPHNCQTIYFNSSIALVAEVADDAA